MSQKSSAPVARARSAGAKPPTEQVVRDIRRATRKQHSSEEKIENYYLPGELEARIEAFVDHYNHQRHHESLNNLAPAIVYFGRGQAILQERERIKRQTIQRRRLLHHQQAA